MPLKVVEVKSSAYYKNLFEKYRIDILTKYKNEKKIKNYSLSRLDIQNLLGLFLILDVRNNKVAGFVSVCKPKIWPEGIARISNRTWIDPDYRMKGLSLTSEGRNLRHGLNWGMTIAYEHQLNCCRKNKISLAVVTRENTHNGIKSKNRFPLLHARLKKIKPEWKLAGGYYLTCSNKNTPSCWQRLIYMELNKPGKKILEQIPKINFSEYNKQFNHTGVV